ncbi:SDR family oxidoreductase [Flavobacterium sp.]|uniref:SDR family NAD(P)-dependent oxidoreductase n=1 Tax=Flavobacterium sp. TaxID=239 RepID=UPI00286AA7C2|nr:SDR family oxidoreductase [Flavobacterium sp.]
MNILITGGASGLGEAITRNFAKDSSHQVYFTFNSSDEKAKAIENDFPNAIALQCNFKNAESVAQLQNKINELNLDVLINNAYSGEPIKTYFHKIAVEDFATEFTDNLIPTIQITQAVIANFRKKKSGKIITVLTSFLLNTPPTGSAVYLANKAYLASLVKTWATENGKYNITSNSISPSFMLSGLTQDVDERVIEQMIESHPLKKLLTLQETADTILFMANATAHMNGLDIVLNAGTNLK